MDSSTGAMVRGLGRACLLAALAAVTPLTLQGCSGGGGGGGGGGSGGDATTTPSGPLPTTTTTITTTKPGKADFYPIRGAVYKAPPIKEVAEVPSPDYMQVGYRGQWGADGRDDLGIMRQMGVTSVRIKDALGDESLTDHGAFLDRAEELGMHVVVGFHTQNVCPDFDCFDAWKKAAAQGFKAGILDAETGNYHPAVALIVLMDEPDNLNFVGDPPPTCEEGAEGKCRTKAALSALNGLLAAERDAKVNPAHAPNVTIAWSFAVRDSVDGSITDTPAIFGFLDMQLAIANPPVIAGYRPDPDQGCVGEKAMQEAYRTRWMNSANSPGPWSFVQEKIADNYEQFLPTPWFLAEFRGDTIVAGATDLGADLTAADTMARKDDAFRGLMVAEFQHDYLMNENPSHGFFGLGAATGKKVTPCEEDPRTNHKNCLTNTDVYCLNPIAFDQGKRAQLVAQAWGGAVLGVGMCPASPEDLNQISV